MMSDFVERGAINRVTPQYPPAAKARGTSGNVRVRVLINKQGLVEKTCPEYVKNEPKPDRSLVIAAEAAALQWTFDRNFGVKPGDGIRFNYIQGVLVFNFTPEESKEK
jgi:TonB family protein